MNFLKKDLVFVPVGGSEQIGMNANLYHYNDNWFLIDLGISFADEANLGVDVILPDFEFVKSFKNKLVGIFLTHAHQDHYGAISYYANEINCPVVPLDAEPKVLFPANVTLATSCVDASQVIVA